MRSARTAGSRTSALGTKAVFFTIMTGLIGFLPAGAILNGAAAAAGAGTAVAPQRTPAEATEVFDSDVFVVSGAGELVNPDPRSTPKSQELFNIAGEDLGLTFGKWQRATATSLAELIQRHGTDQTDVLLTLKGLMPNEVYSLFYETFGPDSANPVCPAVERLVALPALHPSPAQPDDDSFVTDASGKSKFHARVAGDLLAAQRLNIVVIAHFDAKTYGPVPNRGESINCSTNGYGSTAARQLLIIQTGL
jgi:hypothetical protein